MNNSAAADRPAMRAQTEPYASVISELVPLYRDYWDGAPAGDTIQPNPDWALYEHLDRAGVVQVVTMREGERLVGYWLGFLTAHPNHAGVKVATSDTFHVRPEFRDCGAVLLFREVAQHCKALGAVRLIAATKTNGDDDSSKLFGAVGFKPAAIQHWLAL